MVVVITLVVLGIIAWISFSGNNVQDINLLVSDQETLSATERVILENLNKLESININGDLFQNPAFGQLQDFSRTIIEEPQGRNNPFDKVDLNEINSLSTDAQTDNLTQ